MKSFKVFVERAAQPSDLALKLQTWLSELSNNYGSESKIVAHSAGINSGGVAMVMVIVEVDDGKTRPPQAD